MSAHSTPPALISASELSAWTPKGRLLFEDVSLELARGSMLLVEGANGSGKSTLLRALLGDWTGLRGQVQRRVPDRSVRFVPQLEDRGMHLPFTLAEIAGIPSDANGRQGADPRFRFLLPVNAAELYWNQASGGERRRTLLYRALAHGAELLLLDEPMNHLDAGTRSLLWSALERYTAGGGAVVLVCHEGGWAPELSVPHARLVLGEPGRRSVAAGANTWSAVGKEWRG